MADRALLERILEEEGIDVSEAPSSAAYVERLIDAMADLFGVPSGVLEALMRPSEIVLWGLVVAIPLGLLWVFREPLRALLKRKKQAEAPVLVEALPALATPPRVALEARLAAGDGPGALKALWMVVTHELSERGLGRFDVEMTNREFVGTVREASPGWSGLAGLTGLARTVDRLLYGDEGVAIDAVRGLAREADALVEGP